jgi:hypothetical protein
MRFVGLLLIVVVAACATGPDAPQTTTPQPAAPAPPPEAQPAPQLPPPLPPLGDLVPDGTTVQITEVSPDDAYYSDRDQLVGQICRVDGDLHRSDDPTYYAGGATCANGNAYYFYKVRAIASDGTVPAAVASGSSTVTTSWGDAIPMGTKVVIAELSPDDAFHQYAYKIIGLSCDVVDEPMQRQEGEFFSGNVDCSDGEDYMFYKVRVVPPGAPTTASVGSAPPPAGGLKKGSRFKITAVSPDDAYYDDAATIVGNTCTASDDMSSNKVGFYAGQVTCDNGKSYYFYQVAISDLVTP